jgi:DNA-binding PadR family transcriptional regulator
MARPRKRAREEPETAREAVAQAARVTDAKEAARRAGRRQRGPADPLIGGLRRADVLPLLVLHFITSEGQCYGNQLMERIASVTAGVLSVNPNTMYPLLRQLEGRGLIEGRWEHPERRSRRYYSVTAKGRAEYERLHREVRPLLESIARSIDEIVGEVYGTADG